MPLPSAAYRWRPANRDGICASQNAIANFPLIFDGSLVRGNVSSYKFPNWRRSVVIAAGATNLSAVTFVINGKVGNSYVSYAMQGPGANSYVDSAENPSPLWDEILSIVPDANADDVSVGEGREGHTTWFQRDYTVPFPSLGVQVAVSNNTLGTYRFLHTCFDMSESRFEQTYWGALDRYFAKGLIVPDGSGVQAFHVVMNDEANTPSQYAFLNSPTRWCTVDVQQNAIDTTYDVEIAFISQGIIS